MASQRIDSWLFCVRLCKTRRLAAEIVSAGAVRINRRKIRKPATPVHVGDVLTLVLHGRVRVVEVTGLSPRRVSAAVAVTLRRELDAPTSQAMDEGATTRPCGRGSSNENRV